MIDSHIVPNDSWGVLPYIHIGTLAVPTYSIAIGTALVVGGIVYGIEAHRAGKLNDNSIFIAFAGLLGGTIGAKILVWVTKWRELVAKMPDPSILLSGRSIVGGLLGGTIAVRLTKKYLGIKTRRGNLFAPAVALGMAIGRIGCFLRGCCFGLETHSHYGVDFGDGVLRHPTQLYEAGFDLLLFIYLMWAKNKNPKPGSLFTLLLTTYFIFRFFIEFIKYEPDTIGPFTIYQVLSILAILYLQCFPLLKRDPIHLPAKE